MGTPNDTSAQNTDWLEETHKIPEYQNIMPLNISFLFFKNNISLIGRTGMKFIPLILIGN